MALVPWDPIRNLISLQDRMNRLFDETMHRGRGAEAMDMGTWAPPVDIYETETEIVLVAEVPGVDEKDVDVEVKDNLLTIKGERRMEKSVREESYHRVERAYGGFSRSFTLPQAVDSEKITATYNRGVLEIRLPKPEKAKTHQIKIETKE
jgi:HSP20 family protein